MSRVRVWILFLGCLAAALVTSCAPAGSDRIAPGPPGAPTTDGMGGESSGAAVSLRSGEGVALEAASAQQSDRLIARTTGVSMNVSGISQAIDAITDAVIRRGGYVASTNFKNDGDRAQATLSVRVPSRDADDFLREARRIGSKVNEENTTSQDVTEEYADLGAQLRNLQATEQQYLDLMRRAQTVEDILKVQQQLSNVRGQIERTHGRIQSLERRTDFSQVNFTLLADVPSRAPWDAGRVAREAWDNSLVILEKVAEAVITVAVLFWWVVPLSALALGVRAVLRQRRAAAET